MRSWTASPGGQATPSAAPPGSRCRRLAASSPRPPRPPAAAAYRSASPTRRPGRRRRGAWLLAPSAAAARPQEQASKQAAAPGRRTQRVHSCLRAGPAGRVTRAAPHRRAGPSTRASRSGASSSPAAPSILPKRCLAHAATPPSKRCCAAGAPADCWPKEQAGWRLGRRPGSLAACGRGARLGGPGLGYTLAGARASPSLVAVKEKRNVGQSRRGAADGVQRVEEGISLLKQQ
eukprot:scaffold375_cov378-Prasinococcus_capsulatus_cf.AAC.27